MPQIYRINLYVNLGDLKERDNIYVALLAVLKAQKSLMTSIITNGISKDDYYQPTTVSESA